MVKNISDDEQQKFALYLQLANKVKHSLLVQCLLSINAIVNVCGIVSGTFLIFTTIRNRSLHSICHVLIAVQSLASIFGFLELFIPLSALMLPPPLPFFSAADQQQSPLVLFTHSTCFYLQSLILAPSFNIYTLMLAISVDRMLSLFVPIWYLRRSATSSATFLFAYSLLYPIYAVYLMHKNLSREPNKLTICFMGDALGSRGISITIVLTVLTTLLSIICYSTVYAKLKWDERKPDGKTAGPITYRLLIFKSISRIILLQIVGWSGGIVAYFVVSLAWKDDSFDAFMANSLINCFICLCANFEVPILYLTSSLHQKAMRKEYESIVALLKKPFALKSTHKICCCAAGGSAVVGSVEAMVVVNPSRIAMPTRPTMVARATAEGRGGGGAAYQFNRNMVGGSKSAQALRQQQQITNGAEHQQQQEKGGGRSKNNSIISH